MKPFFSKVSVAASSRWETTTACNCVRAQSVTGTVTIRINGGDIITLNGRDVYELPFPMVFEKITVEAAASSSAVLVYGLGSFGGSGGGSGQLSTGSGAPTSNPADTNSAAIYYDYTNAAIYNWNTNTQAWE